MSIEDNSRVGMDEHTTKVVQALVMRSLDMRGKNKISQAADFIAEAISTAPADNTEIVLPARFATATVLNWISELGLEVHDKNKLVIPTAANPFANCRAFERAIEKCDTDNAPVQHDPTPQPVDQTPTQPSRKRKLVEPGAPVAERRNVVRKESVEPRRIDFADQSPEKEEAKDEAAQPEVSSAEISQEEKQRRVAEWVERERSLEKELLEEEKQRRVAEWVERERSFEKELMEAIVSRDSAADEDTRRIREDKVSIARRNYRSAVKALEMAQQILAEQKK